MVHYQSYLLTPTPYAKWDIYSNCYLSVLVMHPQKPRADEPNAPSLSGGDETRKALRQHFREQRRALSPKQQQDAAHGAVTTAQRHRVFASSKRIAVYLSHDGELDTKPLIKYLWAQQKEVYLPILHPFCKGHLLFLRYTGATHMTVNRFNIAEPCLDVRGICPARQLDTIITPLVAFDEQGNRMGMGGGFYDRTLQFLNTPVVGNHRVATHSPSPVLLGLAHDVQKAVLLPTQVWDVPLPAILTPTTLHSF